MSGRDGEILRVGTLFEGNYEIVGHIGAGGFGDVYEARQLTTGQPVAIKVMRGELAAKDRPERFVARFRREMQLCARLHHPNIVPLIDSGTTPDGRLFAIFAYVTGKTLGATLAAEGRLDPVEATRLMTEVLDGLGAAHKLDIVHRDIKPANIMLTSTGARRNAVVLDFGIGTVVRRDDGAATQVTETAEFIGTPLYAAPEQLRGQTPSTRSDLYSWGLVFLECLSGRPVMAGASPADVAYKHLAPEPVPLPPGLDRHPLGALLSRTVEKDVDRRGVTAEELLRELEGIDPRSLTDPSIPAGRSTWRRPGIDPASRRVSEEETSSGSEVRPRAGGWSESDGERRQLTVVSCRFQVLPLPGTALDLEDLDWHLGALRRVGHDLAARFGGHVAGSPADQILLYFGYPTAHEDAPRRAARAAIELLGAVERHGEQYAGPVRVEARIGVHTGLVLARTDPGLGPSVVGDVPGVAGLVARHATAGTALVTDATRRLVERALGTEPAGSVATDGGGEPLAVFALRPSGVTGRSLTSLFGPESAPMVGRTHELELLRERWQRAVAGEGQPVLVTGEPGIGKSRLVRELVLLVSDQSNDWIECRCNEDARHSALQPFVELLERLAGFEPSAPPERRAAQLERLLETHGMALEDVMPLLAPLLWIPLPAKYRPLSVAPAKQRTMTLEAILDLLFRMAEARPLLLVVEDLHWADPSSLELIARLVAEAPTAPICAILTARPEFTPPWPAANILQIQVARLVEQDVGALATGVARRALPPEVIADIARRTDGVSLFVEELTRLLVDSGFLRPVGDHYEASGKLSQAGVPSTLRDLLAARLDRLGAAKATAQLAAVLGREFTQEVLAAVSPLDAQGLADDLAALTRADLVHRRRRPGGTGFAFKHALIRDMAYESLRAERRRELHGQVAAAIEARFPDVVEREPWLLAHHHAAAHQIRPALDYATKAGFAAVQRASNAEAIGYATEATAWLARIDDPRERAGRELALNGVLTPALMATRGWGDPALKDNVERALALVDQIGSTPAVLPALNALSLYYNVIADRRMTRSIAERILEMAEGMGAASAGQQVATLPLLVVCEFEEGRFASAAEIGRRAMALYDPEAHAHHVAVFGMDSRVLAQAGLALVLTHLGKLDEGLALARAAEDWGRTIRHKPTTVLASMYRSMVHVLRGERAEAAATAGEVLRESMANGYLGQLGYGALMMGWATGNLEQVAGVVSQLEAMNHLIGMPFYRALWVSLEAERGNHAQALALVERSIAHSRESGNLSYLAASLRMRGDYLLLLDAARTAEAEALYREALGVARAQGALLQELEVTASLARLDACGGGSGDGRALLAATLARFTEGLETPLLASARQVLGGTAGSAV